MEKVLEGSVSQIREVPDEVGLGSGEGLGGFCVNRSEKYQKR